MTPFTPPAGYPGIVVVADFAALVATPLANGCNAVCWPRELDGDFAEVVACLDAREDLLTIDEAQLRRLPVGPAGRVAVGHLLADLRRLREHGHAPALDCIRAYARDVAGGLPTDVHSFHVDSATAPTDTFLCTYSGAPSEGLRNDEAVRRIDDPRLRERLRAEFGGPEGPGFAAFLRANCHDLHYVPRPGARPFGFGRGNLWRLAVAHPESRVAACIHRAPDHGPGQPPRLLLIS